jgi:hypothetical protein
MTINDLPNRPRLVHKTRKNRASIDQSTSESELSSDSNEEESEDHANDEIYRKEKNSFLYEQKEKKKTNGNTFNQKNTKSKKNKQLAGEKAINHEDKVKYTQTNNKEMKKDEISNHGSIKITTLKTSETKNKRKHEDDENVESLNETARTTISIDDFRSHVPAWGASISFEDGKQVEVTNTCSIDYFLLGLWLLLKRFQVVIPDVIINNGNKTEILKMLVENIEKKNWNNARQFWIIDFLNYRSSSGKQGLSLKGTEYEMYIKPMAPFLQHNIIDKCKIECSNHQTFNVPLARSSFTIRKTNDIVSLYYDSKLHCERCQSKIVRKVFFLQTPSFLLAEAIGTIYTNELPQTMIVQNIQFRLVFNTLYDSDSQHFTAVFHLNGDQYLVDDLSKSVRYLIPLGISGDRKNDKYQRLPIGTCLYYAETLQVKKNNIMMNMKTMKHPDEWTELELQTYLERNALKYFDWFKNNYKFEPFTLRKTDENNIASHYFTSDQQIFLIPAIEKIMNGYKIDIKNEGNKRFIWSHLFQKIMTDIVLETYGCNIINLGSYIKYVIEERDKQNGSRDAQYLDIVKIFKLKRINEWLNQ